MSDRILDISDRPARLSVRNGLLVLEFAPVAAVSDRRTLAPVSPSAARPESDPGDEESPWRPATESRRNRDPDSGLRARGSEISDLKSQMTVPLADIAVLITSHPQISFTHAVLAGLAAAGGIFIACNEKHMPAAMMLPLETHSTQAERFAKQAAAPVPLRKRAWQQIVQAKLRAQGRLLEERTGKDWGLGPMAAKVRSGDPDNLEARAARIYWQALFGDFKSEISNSFRRDLPEGGVQSPISNSFRRDPTMGSVKSPISNSFRRDPEGEDVNPHLNYGYAVLRAISARALCAAGLHPSLGVHHHNRYDAFCLADDLMEPFRPLVDRVVAKLRDERLANFESGISNLPAEPALDREAKRAILEGLLGRFSAEGESRTLFDWVSRAASSLASAIERQREKLDLPSLEIENPQS